VRKFSLLVLVGLSAGSFLFFKNFELRGLENVSVVRRSTNTSATPPVSPTDPTRPNPVDGAVTRDTIRVASFNIQVFGTSKSRKPQVMEILAETVRMFDVVAIQEVRSKDQTIIPRFVDQINASGARYAHIIGPRLGRTSSKEQYVFIFNTDTIEVDHSATYTVADPSDRLHREPLVGLFRARAPPGSNPFTFQLVNIHTDPDEVKTEVDALADVFRAVQGDSTNERDVIILGDLNASEYQLGALGRVPGITWAIAGQKTNTRRTKSYDNLIFHGEEAAEYTGRSGVVDLVREFNLTQEQALAVSDHLPVWAEFSVVEGGGFQTVATRFEDAADSRR